MGLIDHKGHVLKRGVSGLVIALGGIDQLIVDQEQLERIDAAHNQVIVSVFAVVEMETAQAALVQQKSHDLLDVGTRSMVTQVNQDLCLRAEMLAHGE